MFDCPTSLHWTFDVVSVCLLIRSLIFCEYSDLAEHQGVHTGALFSDRCLRRRPHCAWERGPKGGGQDVYGLAAAQTCSGHRATAPKLMPFPLQLCGRGRGGTWISFWEGSNHAQGWGGGGFGCSKSLSPCLKLSGLSQGTASTNMGSERQILTDLNPRSAPWDLLCFLICPMGNRIALTS